MEHVGVEGQGIYAIVQANSGAKLLEGTGLPKGALHTEALLIGAQVAEGRVRRVKGAVSSSREGRESRSVRPVPRALTRASLRVQSSVNARQGLGAAAMADCSSGDIVRERKCWSAMREAEARDSMSMPMGE